MFVILPFYIPKIQSFIVSFMLNNIRLMSILRQFTALNSREYFSIPLYLAKRKQGPLIYLVFYNVFLFQKYFHWFYNFSSSIFVSKSCTHKIQESFCLCIIDWSALLSFLVPGLYYFSRARNQDNTKWVFVFVLFSSFWSKFIHIFS